MKLAISNRPNRVEGEAGAGPEAVTGTKMAQATEEHSFATSYMELCRKHRLRPLPMICVTLPHSLNFTTDRVKMDDWKPILNSLSFDRTLKTISVRSKYQSRKLFEQINSEKKARVVSKAPAVLTRYLLEWLSHSLGQCLRYSNTLTSLELEGVPVPDDCLVALCLGLSNTKSLQHLSLQKSRIGDGGCEIVCRAISNVQSIRSLNLSQCDLTTRSGAALSAALSRQKLNLYHDAWQQSLRYREPKLEKMPGLRRLTLNGNSKLGNEAVTAIVEAIGDNLWFKALDLQQCGLTEGIAKPILDLLQYNKTIVIIDVRLNSEISEQSIKEITKQLDQNDLRAESEYRWLVIPEKEATAKRVSSATNLQKQKQTEADARNTLSRPRSAMIRQVKRPVAPIVFRKSLTPMAQIGKRIKTKSPRAVNEKRPRQPMKPTEPFQTEVVSKVSLHLDLLSQIQPLGEPVPAKAKQAAATGAPEKAETAVQPVLEESVRGDQESLKKKLQDLRGELAQVRKECNRLDEESQRNRLMLAEERTSREFAEQKLEFVNAELAEMKVNLQRRERDSRGYFLMSQKSMDEICDAFGKLMHMFDETSRKTSDSLETLYQDDVGGGGGGGVGVGGGVATDDIRRRLTLIIRKTKSENLKRGYFVDEHAVFSRLPMGGGRYGGSESNIRATIQPLAPVARVERCIGDTVETIGLPKLLPNYQGQLSSVPRIVGQTEECSGDRAREIFASFVNGRTFVRIRDHTTSKTNSSYSSFSRC